MSQVIVGKWGKNLAVRLPRDVAKAAGVIDGERVEIEARNGDIVIRRRIGDVSAAQAAAEEILAEGEKHSLDGISIRELIDEGRRG